MNFVELPHEILHEVISWLPMFEAAKLRAVSKGMLEFMSSPEIKKIYIDHVENCTFKRGDEELDVHLKLNNGRRVLGQIIYENDKFVARVYAESRAGNYTFSMSRKEGPPPMENPIIGKIDMPFFIWEPELLREAIEAINRESQVLPTGMYPTEILINGGQERNRMLIYYDLAEGSAVDRAPIDYDRIGLYTTIDGCLYMYKSLVFVTILIDNWLGILSRAQ